MPKLKRIVAIIIATCLVAFAGYRIRQAYQIQQTANAKKKGAGANRVVQVAVSQSRAGSVREEVLLTGALKPKEQVDVVAKAPGRLLKINYHIGDLVKRDDLIAQLEDDELEQQVKRAIAAQGVSRASRAQREAELKNAKADLGRAETLFKEGLIPRQDLDARQTSYQVVNAQLELARAQEEQSQAELNELQIRRQQTRIYAPMTGIISKRHVDVGALVGPSNPIVSIVNLSVMVVAANVAERDIGKIRVGNRAMVEVDAFGDRKFAGRVARIAPVLDPATRSAMVEVEIPNDDAGLKAEMFSRVTLDLASTREAVLIPRDALVYRGQQSGVFLVQNKKPVFRPIETGLTRGDDVEVLGNLNPGITVITRGAAMLTEGDQIRIGGGRPERREMASKEPESGGERPDGGMSKPRPEGPRADGK